MQNQDNCMRKTTDKLKFISVKEILGCMDFQPDLCFFNSLTHVFIECQETPGRKNMICQKENNLWNPGLVSLHLCPLIRKTGATADLAHGFAVGIKCIVEVALWVVIPPSDFALWLLHCPLPAHRFFPTPWFWVWPCHLPWCIKRGGHDCASVPSVSHERPCVFPLVLLCLCRRQEKSIPWSHSWSKKDGTHELEPPQWLDPKQSHPGGPADLRSEEPPNQIQLCSAWVSQTPHNRNKTK